MGNKGWKEDSSVKKETSKVVMLVGLVLLVLIAVACICLHQVRSIPAAIPISDAPDLTDPSGQLVIKSIRMSPAPERSLRSLFGKVEI